MTTTHKYWGRGYEPLAVDADFSDVTYVWVVFGNGAALHGPVRTGPGGVQRHPDIPCIRAAGVTAVDGRTPAGWLRSPGVAQVHTEHSARAREPGWYQVRPTRGSDPVQSAYWTGRGWGAVEGDDARVYDRDEYTPVTGRRLAEEREA